MKRFACFLSLFLLIFGLGIPLFSQVPDSTPPIVIPPISEGFGFGSLVAISGITIFLAALFNKMFKVIAPLWKQIISWTVSVLIVGGANLINIGFAADLSLVATLLYGLANGLLSNGIFDLSFIRLLLSFFHLNDPPIAIVEPPTIVTSESSIKGNFNKK